MENNKFLYEHAIYSTLFKRIMKLSLISFFITLLQACGSTTPTLDAQIGTALMQAKTAQSLPPSEPVSIEAMQLGEGLTSAIESLRGMSLHNTGRPAPSALTVK
ncbi:hypothetical protein [Limnohabitans sp. 2KL-3]|uniref:hypothetical protein n=1 Tax=Limnohabitans sp. 2KL-3 TaxID=1100700 RepID=UPI001892CB24|nr:hypothetical protein [Limnohabitans sp. 2KL-3]